MKRAAFLIAVVLLLPVAAMAAERGLLWRVVQTCVATHALIGVPFPCVDVNVTGGLSQGYAVLRAPLEATHVIVSPTVRTIGVEAARLRSDGAPNYFADAWSARHFVAEKLAHHPDRSDMALAVNSRTGRSQDQLHIHVDCIRQTVKHSLTKRLADLRFGTWTRTNLLAGGPRYDVTPLSEAEFARTNVFKLVQTGLGIEDEHMDEVTIVMVGVELPQGPGFVVMTRRRIPNSRDEAHGEALMDHACTAFQ